MVCHHRLLLAFQYAKNHKPLPFDSSLWPNVGKVFRPVLERVHHNWKEDKEEVHQKEEEVADYPHSEEEDHRFHREEGHLGLVLVVKVEILVRGQGRQDKKEMEAVLVVGASSAHDQNRILRQVCSSL